MNEASGQFRMLCDEVSDLYRSRSIVKIVKSEVMLA